MRLAVVLALLGLLLSGCGWQLRGATSGNLQGVAVAVVTEANLPQLERSLRRGFEVTGATLVEPDAADAVLVVLAEDSRRRAQSVDRRARVREYELEYSLRFRLERADGSLIAGPEVLSRRRGYRYDATDVLATQAREEEVRQELRREVTRLLLARAQALIGNAD